MHANQTPAQTISIIPSESVPALALPVVPPDAGEDAEDQAPDDADDDNEEAGYGHGV